MYDLPMERMDRVQTLCLERMDLVPTLLVVVKLMASVLMQDSVLVFTSALAKQAPPSTLGQDKLEEHKDANTWENSANNKCTLEDWDALLQSAVLDLVTGEDKIAFLDRSLTTSAQ